MLLRTKLSLITLAFFVFAAVGLSAALNHWAGLRETEFGTNVSIHQVSLWQKIIDGTALSMEDEASVVTRNEKLLAAIAADDQDAVRQIARETFVELSDRNIIDRLELFSADAAMLFSSQTTYFPTPILNKPEIISVSSRQDAKLKGLEIDVTDGTMVVLAIPLGKGVPSAGVAVLSVEVERALDEFSRLTGGDVFLINRRGRLMSGTRPDLWGDLSEAAVIDPENPVQSIALGPRSYWITIGRAAGVTNDIGFAVSVKDVTEDRDKFLRLERTTYGAAAAFLIFAALALWAYMRHSLNPLSDAIKTLRTLSDGRIPPRMRIRPGNDEVSLISLAIDKFRGDTMRLTRMTRSRRNRGQRQARLIRRELTSLAETLDAKAKKDVLNDLDEIEARVQAADEEDEDTKAGIELAAIALALGGLRDRIQDQHKVLADTIVELEEALESKNAYVALQHELSIGTRVQLAMLPDDLPTTERLAISGLMEPAKEVGGDFYDFFYLDDDRLGVVVADVSGKGVPAALFMAISRSILRATAATYDAPGECLKALNHALCDNNKEDLFVTVFYGILGLTTGRFVYANGGHNPTYHLKAGGSAPESLPLTNGVALGVMDGLEYAEADVTLGAGDTLFLYTDGITEAINENEEEYMESRLEKALAKTGDMDVSALLKHVVEDVHAFAGDTPQADDITSVALRFEGAGGGKMKRKGQKKNA